MSLPDTWSISHRQLVSAVIALALPDLTRSTPPLFELGYSLVSLELPMTDRLGNSYRLDLHLVKDTLNLSIAMDCKTWPDALKQDQIDRYLDTPGTNVVAASGIVLEHPQSHKVDAVFVVLQAVEAPLASMINRCPVRSVTGLGIVRIEPRQVLLVHDELSDAALSASLSSGWEVDILRLPLERLPYDADAPRWALADSILRTLQSFFASRKLEFDVEDLCVASNALWQYMEPSHSHLRERVRNEVRTLRRTALKNWLERVNIGAPMEGRWRFTRQPTSRADVLSAFARRHSKYISILRDEDRDPRPGDFVNIDPEQLILF
jgi:hypothetical protein